MQAIRHDDPDTFSRRAHDFLYHDEARNNVFIGLVSQLKNPTQAVLVTIEDAGAVVAVALMTPSRHLMITDDPPPGATDLLADLLMRDAVAVPGVQTTPAAADHFARLWCTRTNSKSRTDMRLALYRLDEITWPTRIDGRLRRSAPADTDLVTEWICAFSTEIGEGPENSRELAMSVIEKGRLHFWELAGVPVSMAAWARATPRGCAINLVYTPQKLRARGYASACVAHLSHQMLTTGKSFCTLYTDLANPTSNKIYSNLGYFPIAQSHRILFQPPPHPST